MTLSFSLPKSTHASENWLQDILKCSGNITAVETQITAHARQDSLCVICKGSRFLCGKTRCPIMVKANYFLKSGPLLSSEDIAGMSPPSVFIGRIGYPNVYAGPLVPPVHENTSLYDMPERWFGKSIDEIVGFRSLLVRGKHRVHVQNLLSSGKILDQTRELALAENSVDIELNLTKKPRGSIFMDDNVQPFGPSAPIRDLHVANARFDQHVEKAYYDSDLRAANAVLELYRSRSNCKQNSKSFQCRGFWN